FSLLCVSPHLLVLLSFPTRRSSDLAATISAYGWNPRATAKDAIIGNIMEAVAVLDVISVKKITNAVTSVITTRRFTPCKPVNCVPIHSDKPDSVKPDAIAKPPQNKSKIPQGNLTVVSQYKRKSPFLFFDGIINNKIAKVIAITPSLIPGINFAKKNVRVIHENAAKEKTVRTSFSSVEAFP